MAVTMAVTLSLADEECLLSDIVDAGGAGNSPVTRLSLGAVVVYISSFSSSRTDRGGSDPEAAWHRNDQPEAR